MTRSPISVIILTLDEELNLPKCLENVSDWADEIIIVDSFSTDKTLEIAEKYGAKIYKRKFVNQAEQFNWALDNVDIKNEWIFRLDADEWLTEELKNEIIERLKNVPDDVSGFCMKRRVYFMGRWIKHGGYYPAWFLRFFRKGKARMEEREVDEHFILLEGRSENLKHDFADENKKDLAWWIGKHNDYSSKEMRERMKLMKNTKQKKLVEGQAKTKRWLKEDLYMKFPLFCRAFLYFIYRYFFRLGFLDGREGLIFHFLQGCWHQFLIDAKIYEKSRKDTEKLLA